MNSFLDHEIHIKHCRVIKLSILEASYSNP
jgi:hypothetical protein